MGIKIEDNLDKLIRRLKRKGPVSPSADLYSEGIKCKFRLARHCIDMLQNIEHWDESAVEITLGSSTIKINL